MKPKIGLSVRDLDDLLSFDKCYFESYELHLDQGLDPNILKIIKIKETFQGEDISLHSRLSRIFSCNDRSYPEFNAAECDFLKSEIIISGIIGAREVNIHLKDSPLTELEKNKLKKLCSFARKNKIKLLYESNAGSTAKTALDILGEFPELGYCLDFGHINTSIGNGKFGMEVLDFVEKIKLRIVHIHAHNNMGDKDSHNSLDNGTFPWKKILGILKNQNLRKIIIESKSTEDILESKRLLDDYYRDN